MGGLFGGSDTIKPPPVSPPLAIPDVGEETGDIARRDRPKSREEAFLTGELVPKTKKKKFLG